MGDNELSKRWKRPKKRTTPVLERILVRNFNGSCAEIQRSPAELAQADLEDALTRYGGCLIKQLREESFLPENGVFRMNDIVEVGGAELKLSDGNRFLPSTQIRFLGSYFPAIIIKVVTADRYRKGLEETRRAMLTMLGKIRVAIVIKIERSPPRAAEASGTSTNNTNAKSTTTPEDERLSMNDRITVNLLQLFHTSGGQLVALHISKEEVFPKIPDTVFVLTWGDICPDPWPYKDVSPPLAQFPLRALHDLALSYRINGTPPRGRPRNMDHVYLPDVEFHEIDYTRPPRPCIPSQMQPPPGLPPRSQPSSSSQFAFTSPSQPPPSSALQSQLPSGLPRHIPLSPLSQVRNSQCSRAEQYLPYTRAQPSKSRNDLSGPVNDMIGMERKAEDHIDTIHKVQDKFNIYGERAARTCHLTSIHNQKLHHSCYTSILPYSFLTSDRDHERTNKPALNRDRSCGSSPPTSTTGPLRSTESARKRFSPFACSLKMTQLLISPR